MNERNCQAMLRSYAPLAESLEAEEITMDGQPYSPWFYMFLLVLFIACVSAVCSGFVFSG